MSKNQKIFYVICFLNFLGFYACLLILANMGLMSFSRTLSIPLRLLISLCLVLLLFREYKHKSNLSTHAFIVFSALFLLRIFLDFLSLKTYYMPYEQVLFYFVSFAVLPFLTINNIAIRFNYYEILKKSIIFSSFLFSILASIFYREYIGTVGRLTTNMVGEEVLSPLILSYCGALGIGVCVNILLMNKQDLFNKIMLAIVIVVSIIPFFLGASRGSVIALVVPYIFIFFANKSFKNTVKIVAVGAIVFISLIYFSEKFGSGVFSRLSNISSDVEQNNSSALRVQIWKQAFSQFLDNPIIGDRLEVTGFNIYPHNLFIEVLLSTGVLGFIPFMILIFLSFREVFFIFRYYRQYSWIGVIFLQAFTQNMFSGSIYNASWFWFSIALVLSFRRVVKLSLIQKRKYSSSIEFETTQ